MNVTSPTWPEAKTTGSRMSSLDRGQRNSSGHDTVSSISREEDFAIFFMVARLKSDSVSCNWSIVWTLNSSSSSMVLSSFFISRFSSFVFAITVGSESKNSVFAISVGSTAATHQTLQGLCCLINFLSLVFPERERIIKRYEEERREGGEVLYSV